MQTLGLSDSTPRTENRLKSLFWPSIQTGSDVDYLGTQGYWICAIVAVASFAVLTATNRPVVGVIVLLLYYLGGVGVRERSRYAATIVFVMYLTDTLVGGISIVRVIFIALLLSNMRATWIAATWKPESPEAVLPPRLAQTMGDKIADQLPMWLWPKVRVFYFAFSLGFMGLVANGLLLKVFPRIR